MHIFLQSGCYRLFSAKGQRLCILWEIIMANHKALSCRPAGRGTHTTMCYSPIHYDIRCDWCARLSLPFERSNRQPCILTTRRRAGFVATNLLWVLWWAQCGGSPWENPCTLHFFIRMWVAILLAWNGYLLVWNAVLSSIHGMEVLQGDLHWVSQQNLQNNVPMQLHEK